jgi:hypothetical protein
MVQQKNQTIEMRQPSQSIEPCIFTEHPKPGSFYTKQYLEVYGVGHQTYSTRLLHLLTWRKAIDHKKRGFIYVVEFAYRNIVEPYVYRTIEEFYTDYSPVVKTRLPKVATKEIKNFIFLRVDKRSSINKNATS